MAQNNFPPVNHSITQVRWNGKGVLVIWYDVIAAVGVAVDDVVGDMSTARHCRLHLQTLLGVFIPPITSKHVGQLWKQCTFSLIGPCSIDNIRSHHVITWHATQLLDWFRCLHVHVGMQLQDKTVAQSSVGVEGQGWATECNTRLFVVLMPFALLALYDGAL